MRADSERLQNLEHKGSEKSLALKMPYVKDCAPHAPRNHRVMIAHIATQKAIDINRICHTRARAADERGGVIGGLGVGARNLREPKFFFEGCDTFCVRPMRLEIGDNTIVCLHGKAQNALDKQAREMALVEVCVQREQRDVFAQQNLGDVGGVARCIEAF